MFLRPKYLSLNEIRSNFAPRSGVIHGKGNASWSGTRVLPHKIETVDP